MSIILEQQRRLFNILNRNILSEITPDNVYITASNITEGDFKNIKLIVNNPKYCEKPMNLVELHVYIGDNLTPTHIPGLFDIVKKRIDDSDSDAFISGQKTHQPFINGFSLNPDGSLPAGRQPTNIRPIIMQVANAYSGFSLTPQQRLTITLKFDPIQSMSDIRSTNLNFIGVGNIDNNFIDATNSYMTVNIVGDTYSTDFMRGLCFSTLSLGLIYNSPARTVFSYLKTGLSSIQMQKFLIYVAGGYLSWSITTRGMSKVTMTNYFIGTATDNYLGVVCMLHAAYGNPNVNKDIVCTKNEGNTFYSPQLKTVNNNIDLMTSMRRAVAIEKSTNSNPININCYNLFLNVLKYCLDNGERGGYQLLYLLTQISYGAILFNSKPGTANYNYVSSNYRFEMLLQFINNLITSNNNVGYIYKCATSDAQSYYYNERYSGAMKFVNVGSVGSLGTGLNTITSSTTTDSWGLPYVTLSLDGINCFLISMKLDTDYLSWWIDNIRFVDVGSNLSTINMIYATSLYTKGNTGDNSVNFLLFNPPSTISNLPYQTLSISTGRKNSGDWKYEIYKNKSPSGNGYSSNNYNVVSFGDITTYYSNQNYKFDDYIDTSKINFTTYRGSSSISPFPSFPHTNHNPLDVIGKAIASDSGYVDMFDTSWRAYSYNKSMKGSLKFTNTKATFKHLATVTGQNFVATILSVPSLFKGGWSW
jgi:hypothetical protein